MGLGSKNDKLAYQTIFTVHLYFIFFPDCLNSSNMSNDLTHPQVKATDCGYLDNRINITEKNKQVF